jgi:hypothetical protein
MACFSAALGESGNLLRRNDLLPFLARRDAPFAFDRRIAAIRRPHGLAAKSTHSPTNLGLPDLSH